MVVHFMCQPEWVGERGGNRAQMFAQTCFWVCLCGSSWMRLTFESGDWVMQIALPNEAGPHPIS